MSHRRHTPAVVTLATNPFAQDTIRRWQPYVDYVAACEAEGLEAHSPHMWVVHGQPAGPLG